MRMHLGKEWFHKSDSWFLVFRCIPATKSLLLRICAGDDWFYFPSHLWKFQLYQPEGFTGSWHPRSTLGSCRRSKQRREPRCWQLYRRANFMKWYPTQTLLSRWCSFPKVGYVMLVPWRAGKVCNMLVPVDTKANVGLLSFFSADKAKKERGRKASCETQSGHAEK